MISIKNTEYVEQRLGYAVKEAELMDWMKRLGCGVKERRRVCKSRRRIFVWISSRMSILVEEFGRLNGYDHIPGIASGTCRMRR